MKLAIFFQVNNQKILKWRTSISEPCFLTSILLLTFFIKYFRPSIISLKRCKNQAHLKFHLITTIIAPCVINFVKFSIFLSNLTATDNYWRRCTSEYWSITILKTIIIKTHNELGKAHLKIVSRRLCISMDMILREMCVLDWLNSML
jgi:hypothetical protein